MNETAGFAIACAVAVAAGFMTAEQAVFGIMGFICGMAVRAIRRLLFG